MEFIKKWRAAPCNKGNNSPYLLCPVGEGDFLHSLYPALSSKQINNLFLEIAKFKLVEEGKLKPYESFLTETNGAELYGGSVVLFGYIAKGIDGNEEGLPASLMGQNALDAASKVSNQVLYVGNAVLDAKRNIRFYLNLTNGLLAGVVDDQIAFQWASFDAFLAHLQKVYDTNYSTKTGQHLLYNQREKGVINNIQFFKFEM